MGNDFIAEENQKITIETVIPHLPEYYVDEHHGEYLVLNPLGPWWFVGSKLHADFVQLCDGKSTLNDIRNSLSASHNRLTDERIISVAKSLLDSGFFTKTVKRKINPLSIAFFNITKRCNLSCPFCYYDSVPAQDEVNEAELDSGVWIKLAGEISKINPRAKIIILGGEPLIRPDAAEIIQEITARHNLKVKLVTNGTLFTEDTISKLSNNEDLSIHVSIDSMLPEVNAKSRGKGSLEKALAAVKQLQNADINFEISSTLTKLNINYIRQFRDFCEQNHYNFRSSIFMRSGEKSKQNAEWLDLSPEEYMDAATYVMESYDPNTTMGHPMVPGERRYSCGMGYGQIDISPDGSVFPCSHINDSKYRIGNIQEIDLPTIIAEGYKRYCSCDVDLLSDCSDKKCPVRYFCAGGCRANALHNFGRIDLPAHNCELLKQTYFRALWVSILGPSYLAETRAV